MQPLVAVSTRTFQHDRFSSQPNEVLKSIFQNVSDKRDLVNLCCACKLFSQIATPLLYACLEIKCPEGYNPRFSTLRRFSKPRPQIESSSNIRYISDLALTTKFEHLTAAGGRCWHHRFQSEEECEERASNPKQPENCKYDGFDSDGSTEEDGNSDCHCERCSDEHRDVPEADACFYEEHFLEFCLGLSENALRSFRWELGSCVPPNILGPHGYLPQYQTRLESIALITDGACDMTMEGINVYDLTKFVYIRSFSWTGPQSKEDFNAIKDCLAVNAGHLEALTLDLIDWSKADDFWYLDHTRGSAAPTRRENFFAEDILGLSLDTDGRGSGVSFPALQNLLLGQVSFDSAISRLVNAFSVFQLKQLKLWNCPRTPRLLAHLTEARQDLALVSLEVTCGHGYCDTMWELQFKVPPFLRKLSGLRDLYLCLPTINWGEIADSICSHLETLERVAVHSRTINTDDRSPYFEEEQDGDPGFCDGFYELFTRGDCDVLGMQYPPAFARECLEPYAKNVSARLLHLRASGDSLTRRDYEFYVDRKEIDSFADWVFGPDGFSELLVLAYGDFAFRDIHKNDNVLYCRNDVAPGEDGVQVVHYKILEPTDEDLWDWVQGNMDALSACAYKALFEV